MFGKKKKEETPALPKLPSLPELPTLPSMNPENIEEKSSLHELPSFPKNDFGDKFSQNNIKNAISGEDEEEEDEGFPILPESKPLSTPPIPTRSQELISGRDLGKVMPEKVVSIEPVFVQIDKFEEGMFVFKKIKKNLEEIEKLLGETKDLKQKEDEELSLWETEIQEMKGEIEKIDKDIFSKI